MEPDPQPALIAIARIVRTRGIRGELLADLHTDFPERFARLSEVWLALPDQSPRLFSLESSWEHKGRRVLKLTGIDTVDAAANLVGAWVKVDAIKAVDLPPGTYYDHDLVGCILLTPAGEELGVVSEVLRIAGNNQLVVLGSRGEYLVPAVEGICKEVRTEQKQIVAELPEGLVDLNE